MERSSRPSGVIPAGTRNELTRNALTIASLIISALGVAPVIRADSVLTSCDGTSLQQAVNGGGLVTFACSGTITLTKTILVSVNTMISGTGHFIDGANTTSIFFVPLGVTLQLDHLNLVNGKADLEGGAVLNKGTLTVAHCEFLNNQAGMGGAISNRGTLLVGNTLFEHNYASHGGAIYNYGDGPNTVNSSTFQSNGSPLDSASGGGAIFNDYPGRLALNGVTLTGNTVASDRPFGGGAIFNQGHFEINDSTVSNNNGGCYLQGGVPTCTHGGVVTNLGGSLLIRRTTFSQNSALGDTAIYIRGRASGDAVLPSDLAVANSTFSENYVGIVDGSPAGNVLLVFTTFSQNHIGYAFERSDPTATNAIFQTTIFSGSAGGNCFNGGTYKAFPSDFGLNLDDDGSCRFTNSDSLSGKAADLLPLADNGGPTQTVAPKLDSPVIDAIPFFSSGIPCAVWIATDQRGVPRPQGRGCDIGAYEVAPTAPPTSSCNGYFTGKYIGDLLVGGTTCAFVGGSISGNLRVVNGKLFLSDVTVGGNIEVTGGSLSIGPHTVVNGNVEIHNLDSFSSGNKICGANIKGDLAFHNSAAGISIGADPLSVCAGNTLGSNLQVHDNSAPIQVLDNAVFRMLDIHNNTGPVQVIGNTVGDKLTCHANSSLVGGPNPGSGNIQGQCYQAPLFSDFGN